jgi:vacuolar protein sorting-associated protein 8
MFSEVGRRNFGRPTAMIVGASIVIGTSKGLALVFDYQQQLIATVGLGTKAVESGAVTSLAISADYSTIATGHATGHIFTWEVTRPAKPFLHILPLSESQLIQRSSDGHVHGSSVVHIAFLGTRHTAIVSADNKGMAFSHLATRGLGAIARSVKTLRILGRYPDLGPRKEKPRKASSVLAFATLPLGNIEHPTDSLGLTALLTPYLLVIVSTTPIAETQFKAPRPKEIPPHSTLSGCLAWFPPVKLKRPNEKDGQVSRAKLVYCWSNILTVLDIDPEVQEDSIRPPNLHFHPRSRWRSPEPIVAVQWLSPSVIGVLTISQRLVILEDSTLKVTDSFDLIQKHIFHEDIFSSQLHRVIENLNEEDDSLHGVIADAFYMSFRVYKGRIFLLGFNDISVGTLSNWADRLAALIEGGEYIEAIALAESYYSGGADKITVGLPEDDDARHAIVKDRLLDILSASLKHMSSGEDGPANGQQLDLVFVEDLAKAAFSACLTIDDMDYLFTDVFEAFQATGSVKIFFQVLEPFILSGEISSVTTEVLKFLVTLYSSQHRESDLESVICHLDTRMMDIDQLASICKSHHLYDGLIHVWNQAIGDYVTPLVELLRLASQIVDNDGVNGNSHGMNLAASKIFPYLAQILTGKTYPEGEDMDEWDASEAKSAVYGFLLSPKPVSWPPGSKTKVVFGSDLSDPDYPYLLLILQYDAPSFLSMLNEIFEDHYLNGPSKDESVVSNGTKDLHSHPTRQMIVGILLDLLNEENFEREDSIYLDMFIARNLPKFPQFIALPGNYLDKLLQRLCQYPTDELADDCQLSVEYLLSYYHPTDLMKLLPLFRSAGFFRVLKSIYRAAKDYAQLLHTYFEDLDDRGAVFDCIGDCLRPGSDLSPKQLREVKSVIIDHSRQLASINTEKTAQVLLENRPDLLEPVLNELDEGSFSRFLFLKCLLDGPKSNTTRSPEDDELHHKFDEQYVELLCAHEPFRVASYIDVIKSGDLHLQKVLPAIESSGAIDAAVILLARDGLVKDAMARLKKHLKTLELGMVGLIRTISNSPDVEVTTEGIEDLLSDVQKYAKVGIWLCQGQTKLAEKEKPKHTKSHKSRKQLQTSEEDLSMDEYLWLELVDSTVNLSKEVSSELAKANVASLNEYQSLEAKINASLRGAVQQCFTALLNATTRPALPANAELPAAQPHPTFLLILRAFLARAAVSSPTLSDLRAVLQEVFQAYAFEERILGLANQFLDKDLFESVEDAWTRRQRGWRPRGNMCERCGKRVWGPGVGAGVWESWQSHSDKREKDRQLKRTLSSLEVAGDSGRGKGKAAKSKDNGDEHLMPPPADEGSVSEGEAEQKKDTEVARPLAVFACRHIWHVDCLEKSMEEKPDGSIVHAGGRELRCVAEH